MRLERADVRPGDLDHERLWGLVGAGAAIAATVVALLARGVDGGVLTAALTSLRCPFHAITGWPCPTCGTTRALLALASGDVAASLRWHPLVFPAAAGAGLYVLYAWAVSLFGCPRVRLVAGPAPATPRLRRLAVLVIAATWAYLVIAGR